MRGVMGYSSDNNNYNNYNNNNSNNSIDYNSNAFRRRQEGENRIYEQQQRERQLTIFNKYLESPEIMLYNAIINEDTDAMSEIMTKHNLNPDSQILYLDSNKDIKFEAGRVTTSLLNLAFGKKKLRVINFLIDSGANYQQPFYLRNHGTTTLIEALNADYTDIINQILSKNPPPDFINIYMETGSQTALKSAVQKGNIAYVKQLVQAGADINETKWAFGRIDYITPLYLALVLKFYEIADFLKESGATRPSMRNLKDGGIELAHDLKSLNWIIKNYPSDFGIPSNTYGDETPENILFKIANLKKSNLLELEFFSGYRGPQYGYMWNSIQPYEDRMNLLKPVLNNIDSNGNTALMVATQANNFILVEYLIRFGAKTAIQNNEGNTSLHLAALNTIGKTGEERQTAINIINRLIQVNQALTKIKNNAGYGAGNPKLGVDADITKLIHGQKPWFRTINTNKTMQGGRRIIGRKGVSRSRIMRRVKTMKVKKSRDHR